MKAIQQADTRLKREVDYRLSKWIITNIEQLLEPDEKDDNLYVPRKRRNGVVHAEMDTHHNFIVWSGMNIYFDYNGQNSQYSVERILVKCPNQ